MNRRQKVVVCIGMLRQRFARVFFCDLRLGQSLHDSVPTLIMCCTTLAHCQEVIFSACMDAPNKEPTPVLASGQDILAMITLIVSWTHANNHNTTRRNARLR